MCIKVISVKSYFLLNSNIGSITSFAASRPQNFRNYFPENVRYNLFEESAEISIGRDRFSLLGSRAIFHSSKQIRGGGHVKFGGKKTPRLKRSDCEEKVSLK